MRTERSNWQCVFVGMAGLTATALFTSVGKPQPRIDSPATRKNAASIVVGQEVRLGGEGNRSQWEASLVVSRKDAKRLLVSCIVDPPPTLVNLSKREKHTCLTFSSADGGVSWTPHEFPREGLFDPVVAFGPDGVAYLAYLGPSRGVGSPPTNIGLQKSLDSGKTWGTRVSLLKLGEEVDHPTMVVDQTDAHYAGRVYVGAYDVRKGVLVFWSDDGARTFQAITAVPDWHNRDAYVDNMLVLSDGTLFVPLGLIGDIRGRHKARFFSIVSTDGGRTFCRPRVIVDEVGIARSPRDRRLRGNHNIVCAVGWHQGKERIYGLWCEGKDGIGLMRIVHSDNCGGTWSEPREVTVNAPAGTSHGVCNLAVSWNGTLGVSWLNHGPTNYYEIWFTASLDGGLSFLPPAKVSGKPSQIPPGQYRPNPGNDYMLMDGGPDSTFHLIWPDARADKAYQLYTCKVTVSR